jgi:hypothetical protein
VKGSTKQLQLLLRGAREGERAALGQLLDSFRPYLVLFAGGKLGADLKPKCSESDLVQRTASGRGRERRAFVPFRAVGDLTFQLDPSLNDASMPTTVPFVNVTGVLEGIPPSPPSDLPFTISPDVQFLGGSLTNIVRVASGHVISSSERPVRY